MLSSVMQQQTTSSDMMSKLAAELEKMQLTIRQLEAKSQSQESQREEALAASQGSSVASEDSQSSENDDSETSEDAFWRDINERERQQNEAKLEDQSTLTATPTLQNQGIQTDLPPSLSTDLPHVEAWCCKELAKWRSAARQYETQTGYYKLRAETAEKKLKQLGK